MVRKYLVIFILLFSCHILFAQTAKRAAIISVKDDISEHSGDTTLKNKLVSLGYEVVSYRDGDLDAGKIGETEFNSNDLIIASESVSSSKLRKILSYGFAVPTINMEPASVGNSHHKLELISTVATGNGWLPKDDENAYKLKILNGEHPLAAGLSTGTVIDLVSDPNVIDEDPFVNGYIGWMVDEIGLIPIASLNTPGGDTSLVISGIEIGTANMHGDIFKARYVQFNVNAFTINAWTAEADQLFEAAIEWVVAGVTDVEEINSKIPEEFSLAQNYPNPFNPSTTFSFSIPNSEIVTLAIYNALGEKVAEVVNKEMQGGNYNFNWSAKNLTSGIYFARLTAGDKMQIKKIMLLK